MPGNFWGGPKRENFLIRKIPGYLEAQKNDEVGDYVIRTLDEYFAIFSKDVLKDPKGKSKKRVGRARREEQIRFYLNNHTTKARYNPNLKEREEDENALPTSEEDALPEPPPKKKVRRPREKSAKLDKLISKMERLDMMRAIILGFVCEGSNYTTPTHQVFQRLHWDDIKAIIDAAFEEHKAECRAKNEEPMERLPFQNWKAKQLYANASDEVKAGVEREMIRTHQQLEKKEDESEEAYKERMIEAKKDMQKQAARNVGDLIYDFLDIIHEQTGFVGIAYVSGEDPDNEGSMKSEYIEQIGSKELAVRFSEKYKEWQEGVAKPYESWAKDCLDDNLRINTNDNPGSSVTIGEGLDAVGDGPICMDNSHADSETLSPTGANASPKPMDRMTKPLSSQSPTTSDPVSSVEKNASTSAAAAKPKLRPKQVIAADTDADANADEAYTDPNDDVVYMGTWRPPGWKPPPDEAPVFMGYIPSKPKSQSQLNRMKAQKAARLAQTKQNGEQGSLKGETDVKLKAKSIIRTPSETSLSSIGDTKRSASGGNYVNDKAAIASEGENDSDHDMPTPKVGWSLTRSTDTSVEVAGSSRQVSQGESSKKAQRPKLPKLPKQIPKFEETIAFLEKIDLEQLRKSKALRSIVKSTVGKEKAKGKLKSGEDSASKPTTSKSAEGTAVLCVESESLPTRMSSETAAEDPVATSDSKDVSVLVEQQDGVSASSTAAEDPVATSDSKDVSVLVEQQDGVSASSSHTQEIKVQESKGDARETEPLDSVKITTPFTSLFIAPKDAVDTPVVIDKGKGRSIEAADFEETSLAIEEATIAKDVVASPPNTTSDIGSSTVFTSTDQQTLTPTSTRKSSSASIIKASLEAIDREAHGAVEEMSATSEEKEVIDTESASVLENADHDADEEDLPAEFIKIARFMRRLIGGEYLTVYEKWILFERLLGFLAKAGRIDTKNRPTEVGKWNQGVRSYSKVPDIRNLEEYAARMLLWWIRLQPLWKVNRAREELLVDAVPKANENYDNLKIGGRMGLETVLFGMGFWLAAINDMPARDAAMMEKFTFLMEDIERALDFILSGMAGTSSAVKRQGPSSSSEETREAKRVRFS